MYYYYFTVRRPSDVFTPQKPNPANVRSTTKIDRKTPQNDIGKQQLFADKQHSFFNKTVVLFNPPATILWKGGKKYVSKAHNEEFDEEKGLLMCLAKANGYTHSDIQKLLNSAKRQDKKE